MADEFSQDSGSKTKLINDMITLMQRLGTEFAKVEAASKGINNNLKSVVGGATGGGGADSVAPSGGTYSGGFSASGAINAVKSIATAAVGVASSVASAMPSVQQAVSSQLLTSQATFSGMQGNVNSTVRSLMGMGTTSSPTDVQQAIAMGTANGVLPGLPGYNSQLMPGVMQLSNLTGSAQSAMQATASLNSGQSVNTMRMMGIAVRGANGAERNPAAIFKDIYNFAVQQSGGRLNANNIAIALQPGNGLANLLDAAAAGDSTLRNALQTAALGETLLSNPVGKGGAGALASIAGLGMKALGAIGGFIAGEVVDPLGGGVVGAALGYQGASALAKGTGLGQGATVGPATSSVQSSAAANLVIGTGQALTGTPYAWGGGSIQGPTRGTQQGSNTVGFDCSSFVQYVFARVGVMLPRTTYAQVNCGVAVPANQAQPGDLLFFDGPATAPGHVGIYIGGNKMMQAPHTGGVIETVGVNVAGAVAIRRVLNGKTGTAVNKNLLKGPHQSVTSMPGNLGAILSQFSGNTLSGASSRSQSLNINDLKGYDPSSAMSGGGVGGSGLGQGSDLSMYTGQSTSMANTYLSISSKTGTLEPSSSVGSPTIHYGGVTIPITVPQGSNIDAQELASLIKKELVSLNISSKVANS